jgi:hypothetical protein
MLAGFNHNVKHKGKLYHVQTEDSGVANPHVITHLFVGGNILASKRTSYKEHVAADDLAAVVRPIMEQQHKEMLRNLVNGVYDEVDSARGAQARAYQPGQIADAPSDSAALGSGRTETVPAALRAAPRDEKPRPVVAAPARSAPPAPAPPARAAPPPPIPAPFGSAAARPDPAAKGSPAPPRPVAPPLRPALTPPPLLQRTPSLPPPPRAAPAPGGPPPLRAAPPDPITGADLLDERSLDEVILSYLAEDLGGRK